jgi:hypothetical protein
MSDSQDSHDSSPPLGRDLSIHMVPSHAIWQQAIVPALMDIKGRSIFSSQNIQIFGSDRRIGQQAGGSSRIAENHKAKFL